MKVTFSKNDLNAALKKVSMAIEPKNPIEAAQAVLFIVEAGVVHAEGTGPDFTVRASVDSSADKDGQFLVNAKILSDIVKGTEADEIVIETGENRVRITAGKAKFNLATPKVEDYPDIKITDDGIRVKMDHSVINQVISHVAFAAAKRTIRPILTGVHFRSTDQGMVAEATDSYRLAQEIYPVMTPEEFSVTIPVDTVTALSTIFNDEDESVDMYITDKSVVFAGKKVVVKANLLDGDYPSVDRFFNIPFGHEWKVDRLNLIGAITRTKFIKNDNLLIVKLDIGKDHSFLENRNQELGDSKEEIDLKITDDSDPMTVSYCGDFILDALKAFEGEEFLSIKSGGDNKPAVIEKIGDSVGMRQLVLPVRTYN